MRLILFIALALSLILTGCSKEPTLQKYFVEHSEQDGFVVLDIASDFLNVDQLKLTKEQREALQSFDKVNILAYKTDSIHPEKFEEETKKINQLLKAEAYQELMRVGSGLDGASVSYVGKEDSIDEFVFYAKKKENGFAVVRVLGSNMSPTHVMNMITVLQQSNADIDQLKPLRDLLK